jgi:hypothetical protein
MSDPWDKLDEHTRAILDGHGGEGVVAVRPSLVRSLKGVGNAAILLSQLLYLSRRLDDGEGWFYQSQRRLEQQTGLGPDAQRKAVRLLCAWVCSKLIAEGYQPNCITALICTNSRRCFSLMGTPCQLPTMLGNKTPTIAWN